MGELEKHARLFNMIAPVYNWFFHAQVKKYRALLDKYVEMLSIPPGGRVLDIGWNRGLCLLLNGTRVSGDGGRFFLIDAPSR